MQGHSLVCYKAKGTSLRAQTDRKRARGRERDRNTRLEGRGGTVLFKVTKAFPHHDCSTPTAIPLSYVDRGFALATTQKPKHQRWDISCSPVLFCFSWLCRGPFVPVLRLWGPVPEVNQAWCRLAWAVACSTDGLRRGWCGSEKNMAVPPCIVSALFFFMAWHFAWQRFFFNCQYQNALQRVYAEGVLSWGAGLGWGTKTSPGMEPWQNCNFFFFFFKKVHRGHVTCTL